MKTKCCPKRTRLSSV